MRQSFHRQDFFNRLKPLFAIQSAVFKPSPSHKKNLTIGL